MKPSQRRQQCPRDDNWRPSRVVGDDGRAGDRHARAPSHAVTDLPFLDFLYPPQTLAWLRRGGGSQPLERWELRNARRLPEGFVHASRGYASRSSRLKEKEEKKKREEEEEQEEEEQEEEEEEDEEEGNDEDEEDHLSNLDNKRLQTWVTDQAQKFKDRSSSTADESWLVTELESLRIAGKGGDPEARELERRLQDLRQTNSQSPRLLADFPGDAGEMPEDLPPASSASNIVPKAKPTIGGLSMLEQTVLSSEKSAIKSAPEQQWESPSLQASPDGQRLASTDGPRLASTDDLTRDRMRILDEMLKYLNDNPTTSEAALVVEAWDMYQSIIGAEDLVLNRVHFLRVLHRTTSQSSAEVCRQVFESVPIDDRPPPLYEYMIRAILNSGLQEREARFSEAFGLCEEAFRVEKTGRQTAEMLFILCGENGDVQWAMRVWKLLIDRGWGTVDSHVKSLVERAQSSSKYMRFAFMLSRSGGRLHDATEFFAPFHNYVYLRALTDMTKGRPYHGQPWAALDKSELMLDHLRKHDPSSLQNLENLITETHLSRSSFGIVETSKVVNSIYEVLKEQSISLGLKPSLRVLDCVLRYALLTKQVSTAEPESAEKVLTVDAIVSDWEEFYRWLPISAVEPIIRSYARFGQVRETEHWIEYLQQWHPDQETNLRALSYSVFVHVQRGDLDKAKAVFADNQRRAKALGGRLGLRAWNILIQAHARVDDIDGALATLEELVRSSGHKADEQSFGPVLLLLAQRGDVSSVEDLLSQYDHLCGTPRSTTMVGSLINAHVNSYDVQKAEEVLRETVEAVASGKVTGPLTKCFNIVLVAHALRRDNHAIQAAWRWMTQEGVKPDPESYGALMQALALARRTGKAWTILRKVMPAQDIRPTALHYAIVLAGFTREGAYEMAPLLRAHMRRNNVRPSMATDVAFRKIEALRQRRRPLPKAVTCEAQPGDLVAQEGRPSESDDRDELVSIAFDRSASTAWDESSSADSGKDFSAGLAENSSAGSDESTFAGLMESSSAYLDESALADYDAAEISSQRHSMPGAVVPQNKQTALAAQFDFVILMQGKYNKHHKRKSLEAVQRTLQAYKEKLKLQGIEDEGPLPIRILTALMSAYTRVQEWEQVEECWKMAKKAADALTKPSAVPRLGAMETKGEDASNALAAIPSDSGRAGQPKGSGVAKTLNRRRIVLNQPLRYMLIALGVQGRLGEAIQLVSQLLQQGYVLDNSTWNALIERLCMRKPPLTLLAYVLTERYLMPGWPGWKWKTPSVKPWPAEKSARFVRLQYIRAKYLRPGELMPQYRTLIYLGRALLEMRNLQSNVIEDVDEDAEDLSRYRGTLKEVREMAPLTLEAVLGLPRIEDDALQRRILRREI